MERGAEMEARNRADGTDDVTAFFGRWVGGSNAGDWDAVAAMITDEAELRDPLIATPVRGREAFLERARAQYEPFPDGELHIVGAPFVAVDGREIAYRWRFTGTHLRPVRPPGFAPTGRPVSVDGASVLRLVDGRVASVELLFDTTDVARQLLAAPPAGSRLEVAVAAAQRVRARWARRRRR